MKINEIKAALANLAQKVEPVSAPSVTPPKAEVKTTPQVVSSKKTSTVTSANHSSAVPVASQQITRTPSTKKSVSTMTAATLAPVTKESDSVTSVSVKVQNQPMVEPEMKSTVVAPKKTTMRKTKTVNVIPINGIEAVIAQHLKAGVDYDTIPGCGRKPALLKAGAEKLAAIYGLRMTSKVINRVERFDQFFVLYEVQTTIFGTDGNIVAEGIGSCNTKERRYQKGDFAANLNTVLKMAKKRSYVDAVLSATCSSGFFTQDIDEISFNTRMEVVG